MVRTVASPAAVSSASSRTKAMAWGETTASVSTSVRLRRARSSSKMVSRANRMPPAAPPARAGLARYMESMVPASAGL